MECLPFQDEVDILRERSGRLTTAESTIDSMRKKVEEGNELKRQLRKLDEKNAQYVHQNMELEEELKKLGPWKSQLELQKKQISELQLKLDEERKTADKFELQFKNLQEKNETLNQEKEVNNIPGTLSYHIKSILTFFFFFKSPAPDGRT